MERESWKHKVQRHLDGLVQALEQRKDSKPLAEYFRNVSNELDQAETLHFKIFQQFWYRHKRVAALLDVKKQTPKPRKRAWNDISHKSRQIGDEFDTDDILSITDAWDLDSEKLEVLKDNIQRCLNEDRDFFKSDRVEDISSPDDELAEAEKAFDSVDKDANGAYRVLKKQVLALRLRLLVPKAKSYCIGRSVNSDKCVTTYLSEKRWANLSPTVRNEKYDKLARWRGHGEKWLSLEEPAIALAFGHIPSEHRCFYEFERRRLPIRAFNAVISTLQAVTILDDLRKLWCRQLVRKRLNTECHPNHCFCNDTDVALDEASPIEPQTRATVDNEQQWSEDAEAHFRNHKDIPDAPQPRTDFPGDICIEVMQRQPDSQSPEQPHIPQKRPSEFETTPDFSLTASKRPRFESRDERQGTPLTPVSHGMASSADDNGSEQSPEESSPASATDSTLQGPNLEDISQAAGYTADLQTAGYRGSQGISFSTEGQRTQNQPPTSDGREIISSYMNLDEFYINSQPGGVPAPAPPPLQGYMNLDDLYIDSQSGGVPAPAPPPLQGYMNLDDLYINSQPGGVPAPTPPPLQTNTDLDEFYINSQPGGVPAPASTTNLDEFNINSQPGGIPAPAPPQRHTNFDEFYINPHISINGTETNTLAAAF